VHCLHILAGIRAAVVISSIASAMTMSSAVAAVATRTGAAVDGTPPATLNSVCDVEPRAFPLPTETPIGVVTPGPVETTPFALPTGEPVDERTATAIKATIAESIACRNAGDFRRAYALFTDRFIAHLLGPPDTLDPDLLARLAGPPTPVPGGDRLNVGDVARIEWLADGRVGAIVVTQNREEVFADYLYLIETDGSWQIDEVVALSRMPRAVATPT